MYKTPVSPRLCVCSPGFDWTVFMSNHSTYQPIAWARLANSESPTVQKLTTTIHDTGGYDGIQRIIFGNSLSFWPHKLLFLDAVRHLSHHALSITLDRFVQIDIDDIFVGKTGIRMTRSDVQVCQAGGPSITNSCNCLSYDDSVCLFFCCVVQFS